MADDFGAAGEQGTTVARVPQAGGGYDIVTNEGDVYAEGGAAYYGGTNMPQVGAGAPGQDIVSANPLANGGYQLVNAQGQTYNFGPDPSEWSAALGGFVPSTQPSAQPNTLIDSRVNVGAVAPSGAQLDAKTIVDQTLADYGLSSLTDWAWGEITQGASQQQVLLDMYQTPQFQQRFPGIAVRQKAGLPPISPANYVAYEDSMKQLENRYGLPQGFLSNSAEVGQLIGGDTSSAEVADRVQQGYAQVAYAPPEVQQAFAAMFGPSGNGALASYFLNPAKAAPLLEQQATAAQISGTMAHGAIAISTDDAMRLAQMGVSQSQVQTVAGQLQTQAPLYDASITERPTIAQGTQGVEAQFGINPIATQQVLQRQQGREAAFSGGGAPITDPYGAHGAGAAKPT